MGCSYRGFDEGLTATARPRTPGRRRRRVAIAVGAVAAVSAVSAVGFAAKGTAAPTVTVVANGLNNPRGLSFDNDGHLWVAEAGTGGDECQPTPGAPTDPTCFGLTGSVGRVDGSSVKRVFTRIGSHAASNGTEAEGAEGISVSGGHVYTVISDSDFVVPTGLSPALSAALFDQVGHLMRSPVEGDDQSLGSISNVGAFDYAWSNLTANKKLDPQFPDANPYGVFAEDHHEFVVDAASNTLDEVDSHGNVTILAFIPNPPKRDAVPTCVAEGPDGSLYIGQLTGVGNGAGTANVYKFTFGHGLSVWQTGFSAMTGCGFGSDGSFYVTEFDKVGFPPKGPPGGDVIKIAKNGTRTTLGTGQLFFPNGFAAGKDGAIYVSNWSIAPGSGPGPHGQVVRIG